MLSVGVIVGNDVIHAINLLLYSILLQFFNL